jgi:predicted HD phosphohydrolase
MSDMSQKNQIVSFRRMEDGTREDYLLLEKLEHEYARQLPGKILAAVQRLDQSFDGYRVTRLQHSLQTATRAMRDGADEELIAAALIHDVGDELAPYTHQDIAAAILRPYVRAEVTWIVAHHALFQNYYYAHHLGGDRDGRDRYKDHPWYGACRDFCANWDQNSFDPEYPTEPLSTFEPIVRRIFSRAPHDARYTGPAGG